MKSFIPKPVNGNQPATQKDLALWGGRLQEQINALRGDVNELKEGQARLEKRQVSLERGQAAILDVVKSIDKNVKDLPAKVERLERAVFPNG